MKKRIAAIGLAAVLMLNTFSVGAASGEAYDEPVWNETEQWEENRTPAADVSIGLSVVPNRISETAVHIFWENLGNGYTYAVLADGVVVGECAENTYEFTGLIGGTTYEFSVEVLDEAGNTVAASEPITVYTDWTISSGITLYEDKTVGNLSILNGSLNLNGYSLTVGNLSFTGSGTINLNGGTLNVKGDVAHTNGTMNIGSGKLLIDGNYALENSSYCYGYLKMTDGEGYVLVGGDFTTKAYYSHSGYLTAGTLELKGDFTQVTTSRSDNFCATESHKVILSGEQKQTISIGSIDTRFAFLELQNFSDDGVEFSKRVTIDSFESNGCRYVFADGSREGWRLEEDEEIVGDLLLSKGTLDLNGHTLTVEGNLNQTGGTVLLNGGELVVNGNYKIQNAGGNSNGVLNMTNESDTVTVTGSFVMQSTQSHQNYLTAGTLTVGGNFYQNNANANNFYTSGTHTTVLNGAEKQTVKFANPAAASSHFCNFKMENTSPDGIVFDSYVYITGALSDTESVFTKDKICLTGSLADGKWSHDLIINTNYTLSEDMLIEGTLSFTNGTLNLNGHTLTADRLTMNSHIDLNSGTLKIKGNVAQTNGTMNIGSGKLLIGGNYALENTAYNNRQSYGYLKMTDGEGYVLVGGDFTTKAYYSHSGYLTAGTLEVKGNFTQATTNYSDNFCATGSHKVILSGEQKQNVTFASTASKFHILEISKSLSNGYIFSRTPLWDELIERETDKEAPSVPQNLRTTRVTSSAVVLKWDQSTDNAAVAGYRVYCFGEQIADITGNSYTHEKLKANTVYKYTVRAYDVEENISADSGVLTVSTVSSANAPSAPSELSTEKREDGIKLTWSASLSANLEGYYIYRNDKQIGTATGLSYLDKTAGKGVYVYYVRAFDDEGNLSNIRNSVTVDNQPPRAPELTLSPLSATSVKLTWKTFDNDIEKYELYRNDILLRTLTDREYTDAGLSVSELYRYSVIAYDGSGNTSAPSETAAYCANDEEAPTVVSIAPEEAKCTDRVKITAAVKDNAAVTRVVFQISADSAEWTDAGTVNISNTKQTSNVSFTLDVSELEDGTYTVRAAAYDFSGNVSENDKKIVSTIHVNHTLPERPDPITLELTEGHAEITWGYPDRDTQYFNIYRSEGGEFRLLRGNYKYSNYFEQEMKLGTNYRYYVTAVNSFGSESEPSEIVEVLMETDDTAPEVTSAYPGNGADIKENPKIQIVCNDNFMLKKLTAQLAKSGSDSFETVYETTLSGYSSLSSFTLKTDGLEDGSYLLKLTAEDAYGNVSVPKVIAYRYESCKLSVPALTAEGLGWRNQLSWETENTEKPAGYVIYRKDAKNASYHLVERVTGTAYSDGQVEAGRTYWYKVEAIDRKGNSVMSAEVSAVPVDEDDTPPVADAGIDLYTVAGKAVSFSGASSYDNRNRIAKYEWDFGDGTNGAGIAVSHAYEKEGTYTAELTVYDTSGNTGTDKVSVTVHDGSYCMADFTVLSEGGVKLSNAMIYCESGGTQPQTYMTDSKGKAVVFAQPGEYDFYFCKDGYLPERKTVKIASEMQPVTVRLEEKELVTGGLTVKPLDYTEMKNLGIDIYAPENQHVYEYTTTVEKKNDGGGIEALVFYTNRNGEIIGGETSYTFTDSEGRTSKMFLHVLTDKEFEEIERIPTVAVLTVTTDIAWTKEFFDVELTILNNADEEFSIENCTASLNLPEGLSIADTYYGKDLTRKMGEIAGGTSKSVSWIVRGDKAGSYDLSADFGGVLMPFEKAVTARFETREPLVVEGGNALYLEETRNMAGTPEYWNVIYKLTNISDKPVYGVRGAVGGFAEFGRVENMKMIYPDGTVVYLEWNAGLPDESSVEIYFDALKYSEYDGADTLEPGESVIIYVTLDLREENAA